MLETEPIELVGTLNVGVVAHGTRNYQELTNKPQINSVELNGNKTSADLGLQPAGNYLTEEIDPIFSASASAEITNQDITNWNNKSDFSGNYNDLTNKPTIPSALSDLSDDTTHRVVTDTEKNTWNAKGNYNKPSDGIPKSDLASDVQTSLGKADTALQSETYTGTITSVKMNGTTVASSGEADLGTVITQHQDISGKLDTSKVKTTTSSTSGDVYDVTYINTQIGNIETLLSQI